VESLVLAHHCNMKWIAFILSMCCGLNSFSQNGSDWPLPDPYTKEFASEKDIASITFLFETDTLRHVEFNPDLEILRNKSDKEEVRRTFNNGLLQVESTSRSNGTFQKDSLRSDGTLAHRISGDKSNKTSQSFYPNGKVHVSETIGSFGDCSYHIYDDQSQATYSFIRQKDGSAKSDERHMVDGKADIWTYCSNAENDTILIERKVDNWPMLRMDSVSQNYMLLVGNPFNFKQYTWRTDSTYNRYHEVNDSLDLIIINNDLGQKHTIKRLQRGDVEWSFDKQVDASGKLLKLDSGAIRKMPDYTSRKLFHIKYHPPMGDRAWEIYRYNENGDEILREHLDTNQQVTYAVYNDYWKRGPKKNHLRKTKVIYEGKTSRTKQHRLLPLHRLKFWRKRPQLVELYEPYHHHHGGCIVYDDPLLEMRAQVVVEVDAMQSLWELGYDEAISDHLHISTDSTRQSLRELSQYLTKHIEFSQMCIEAGIQGTTYIEILTDDNDEIVGFETLKEAHPLLTKPILKELEPQLGNKVTWPKEQFIKVVYKTFSGRTKTSKMPAEQRLIVMVKMRFV
jgi:hypothetical protein